MRKTLKAVIVTAALLAAGQAGAEESASARTPDKMRIGYIPEPAHGLHFLAREKGFFKEEGIDAELYQFNTAAEGCAALKAGKLDIGTFGTAAPLLFITKGAEFTIFGGMMICGQAIIARPENAGSLKSLENFKGKKIGLGRLTTGDVIFRGALKKAGIDWRKDISIVEFSSQSAVIEAVKKGAVDAGIVFSPHFSLAEKNHGLKTVHFIADFYPNYTCCRLDAITSDFNARKDAYKRVLIALIRAYKVYRENPEETVRVFTKALKIDEDIIRKDTYTSKCFESHPDPLKKGTLDFWKEMRDIGYIEQDYPIESHIDTAVYRQALDEVLKRYPGDRIYQELDTFYKANNE
jgi:NitT/TauT family transport system substrate-binding protein